MLKYRVRNYKISYQLKMILAVVVVTWGAQVIRSAVLRGSMLCFTSEGSGFVKRVQESNRVITAVSGWHQLILFLWKEASQNIVYWGYWEGAKLVRQNMSLCASLGCSHAGLENYYNLFKDVSWYVLSMDVSGAAHGLFSWGLWCGQKHDASGELH